MSFDLYREEMAIRIASLPGTRTREPGVWDNFLSGSGRVAMQTLAKAGSAIDMAGAVGPILADKISGGTEAQDRYFREHDEVFGRAVDYWTPKPHEVGVAGQVVGTLLGTLPLVFASPGLAVGTTQMGTGEELVKKGVDAGKAQAVGAVQGAGLGLGIFMPVLGRTLAQRVLIGGAGFNVMQGIGTRAASGVILEGTPAAEEFKAFDPTMLTLDLLLGAAFGGMAHGVPSMRAEGERWHAKLDEWGAKLKPSEVDALVTLRQAQHISVDSMSGKPVDMASADAHVQRIRQAIDDLVNDRPVSVENLPEPKFEPDPQRQAEAVRMVEAMREEVKASGIDPWAQPLPSRTLAQRLQDADTAQGVTDPLAAEALRFADENPDLRFTIERDDGSVISTTPRDLLADAEAELAGARQDAQLFQVAAACLLGAS